MAAMCSERVAIFKAEDDGENEFDTILPDENNVLIVKTIEELYPFPYK
jgi:cytidine deaminase